MLYYLLLITWRAGVRVFRVEGGVTLMSINSARWLRKGFLAIVAVFFLVLVSACGGSNAVHVYDNARVLDQNRVQNEASSLPYSMDIYTVNTFTGTKPEFDRATLTKLGNNSKLIVMAVDTVHHHLAIVRGSNVPLSQSQIQGAVSAFSSNYRQGDYTGPTIATIDSLRNSLGSSPGVGPGLLIALIIIGLVVLGVVMLFRFLGRRSGGFGRGMYQQPYNQPPYQQPYNPGYPPQGYPPNYYGPPQGPGMNPWVAGGLGAAAGGFLGYELGKEAGEREGGEQQQGDGGWAGASGDFGGGGGGDSGGGGGDFGGGGGGDSGGGGSGDF
jgi:hypothetical protein